MSEQKFNRVLRLPEVVERTGLPRDSVYRLAAQGKFPKPLKLSERSSGWLESEVESFIQNRVAARDTAAA